MIFRTGRDPVTKQYVYAEHGAGPEVRYALSGPDLASFEAAFAAHPIEPGADWSPRAIVGPGGRPVRLLGPARLMRGAWALHEGPPQEETGRGAVYALIHTPSGRAVGFFVGLKSAQRALRAALEHSAAAPVADLLAALGFGDEPVLRTDTERDVWRAFGRAIGRAA